jgi:hypothetical protein
MRKHRSVDEHGAALGRQIDGLGEALAAAQRESVGRILGGRACQLQVAVLDPRQHFNGTGGVQADLEPSHQEAVGADGLAIDPR